MNNRLTIPEVAGLLTEYTGKDHKSTEKFLKEFIAVVSEGIFADKIAKIKGIGTFKIISVEERESIHVNTGERIVIPAHLKFSFIPDKDLREEVNKPFSFFETIEITTDPDFPEIPEMNEPETIDAPLPEDKPILYEEESAVIQELASSPESVATEPLKEEGLNEVEESCLQVTENIPDEIPETPEITSPTEIAEKVRQEDKSVSKTSGRYIGIVASICILLAIGGGVFFFLSDTQPVSVIRTIPPEAVEKEQMAEIPAATVVEVEIEDWKPVESEITLGGEEIKEKKEVIAVVNLQAGNRLTLISLEHYGNKIFWVYIYDYNKATIKDPNNIPIGTEIKVPSPELYNINAEDPASVNKASLLQTAILTGE